MFRGFDIHPRKKVIKQSKFTIFLTHPQLKVSFSSESRIVAPVTMSEFNLDSDAMMEYF